jgi:quercetin dioxygenase-like cupin family protein
MRIARGRAAGTSSEQRTATFTGTVWMDPVLTPADGVMVNSVAFQPGARTHWHAHDGGQVLIVTSGQGIVALETGEREIVRAGDTVWFSPGERHWHGAGPDTHMVHTAVSIGTTNWAEPVTDEQYAGG